MNLLYEIGWIAQILGFAALTWLLTRISNSPLAVLALAATVVAAILAHPRGHVPRRSDNVGRPGGGINWADPVIYTAARCWVSAMKLLYFALGLPAQAGYGVALVKTRLVPTWVGKTALGWGLTWLPLLITGVGAPAVLFIVPPVIGAALLTSHRVPSASSNRRKE